MVAMLRFILVPLLLLASSPYILSSSFFAHGDHIVSSSVEGNSLRLILHHHDDTDHSHSHHPHDQELPLDSADHEVVLSEYHATAPSLAALRFNKIIFAIVQSPILPKENTFLSKYQNSFLDKINSKQDSYLTHRRTIILNI